MGVLPHLLLKNWNIQTIVIFRFPNRRKTFVMMNYIAHKVVRHQWLIKRKTQAERFTLQHLMDDTLPRKDGSFPTGIMKWNAPLWQWTVCQKGNHSHRNQFLTLCPFHQVVILFCSASRSWENAYFAFSNNIKSYARYARATLPMIKEKPNDDVSNIAPAVSTHNVTPWQHGNVEMSMDFDYTFWLKLCKDSEFSP